ncbi:MAG: hypothetical protein WBV39_07980, partial [Rudaea sp.]
DTGPVASIDALMSVTPYFRLQREEAVRILGRVERAVNRWREIGASIGMSKRELDQFENAFEHRERQAAHSLISGQAKMSRTRKRK